MSDVFYVIGAGLAGLSVATALAGKGKKVVIYESSGYAGGRCRSFFEKNLNCRIDNGNHLILSGNTDVALYLKRVGGYNSLIGPVKAVYPFIDLTDNNRWVIDINNGFFPWWIFSPRRRVPESRPSDYLKALKLRNANPIDTVGSVLDDGSKFYRAFWEPLTVSLLNTPADKAAASLLWKVITETVFKGAQSSRPLFVQDGLSETFVHPALNYLKKRGAEIVFNARLRGIDLVEERATHLFFNNHNIKLKTNDHVILTVPPKIASGLLPCLRAPSNFHSIINAHFKLNRATNNRISDTSDMFFGAIGGAVHWVFVKNGVVSVTVSASDELLNKKSSELAKLFWRDVAKILEIPNLALPVYRIIKEKQATFSQTPAEILLRPESQTMWKNIFLAGDWVNTNLPATIEGAIRSGRFVSDLFG